MTIIGAPEGRLNHYLEGLGKHLHDKHPEIGLQMAQIGAAFMEMLFLRNFKTTDAELQTMQDRVRWQVHQQTLKARYPDENLKQQAEQLAERLMNEAQDIPFTSAEQFKVITKELLVGIFSSIRDALEEPGKYPVPVPQGAKVLV